MINSNNLLSSEAISEIPENLNTSRLKHFINLDTLLELEPSHKLANLNRTELIEKVISDGFEGVQFTDSFPYETNSFIYKNNIPVTFCSSDRINLPSDTERIVEKHKRLGSIALTVHVGWGIESDKECDQLIESILNYSNNYDLPIYVETHRSTITQDMWRTVELIKRFPAIRFNGDFSHYYCGQEMTYGGMEMKLHFMSPIFERVRFIHGRIASAGSMQMPVNVGNELFKKPHAATGIQNYLDDFLEMWIRAMLGFLKNSKPDDYFIFAPELLSGSYYYARRFLVDNEWKEEADRYEQSLIYKQLADFCFLEAQKRYFAV